LPRAVPLGASLLAAGLSSAVSGRLLPAPLDWSTPTFSFAGQTGPLGTLLLPAGLCLTATLASSWAVSPEVSSLGVGPFSAVSGHSCLPVLAGPLGPLLPPPGLVCRFCLPFWHFLPPSAWSCWLLPAALGWRLRLVGQPGPLGTLAPLLAGLCLSAASVLLWAVSLEAFSLGADPLLAVSGRPGLAALGWTGEAGPLGPLLLLPVLCCSCCLLWHFTGWLCCGLSRLLRWRLLAVSGRTSASFPFSPQNRLRWPAWDPHSSAWAGL
jgi:hypothetical protein